MVDVFSVKYLRDFLTDAANSKQWKVLKMDINDKESLSDQVNSSEEDNDTFIDIEDSNNSKQSDFQNAISIKDLKLK